jgi:hypothetical protein
MCRLAPYTITSRAAASPITLRGAGIEARIEDYGTEYVRYFFEQEGQIVFSFDPDLDLEQPSGVSVSPSFGEVASIVLRSLEVSSCAASCLVRE